MAWKEELKRKFEKFNSSKILLTKLDASFFLLRE